MKKWEYIKGGESDFVGAPEWATMRTFTGGCAFFAEEHTKGSRIFDVARKSEFVIECDNFDESDINILAQRQLVEDAEQDLNECISSTEALIAERGTRYGKFKDGAEIMRDLKHVMHEVDGWNDLSPSQKEALDMIQHKIGRILNGDPNYDDNWKDVAGYATLIVNELNGEAK